MKHYFILCFCMVSVSLFAQKRNFSSQEKEVMRWIFSHRKLTDTIDINRYQFRKLHVMGLKEEFAEVEYEFLQNQLISAPKTWRKKLSKKAKITKVGKNSSYYSYSTPLFTKDGQFAVVVKYLAHEEVCMFVLHRNSSGWEMDHTRFKRVHCGYF